jgi:hypothetical protein
MEERSFHPYHVSLSIKVGYKFLPGLIFFHVLFFFFFNTTKGKDVIVSYMAQCYHIMDQSMSTE